MDPGQQKKLSSWVFLPEFITPPPPTRAVDGALNLPFCFPLGPSCSLRFGFLPARLEGKALKADQDFIDSVVGGQRNAVLGRSVSPESKQPPALL